MDLGIKNKKVLIIGGSTGIGAQAALSLSKVKAKVTIVARGEKNLRSVCKSMGGKKQGHNYLVVDLLNDFEKEEFLTYLKVKKNRFDIIIHSMGGSLGLKSPLGNLNDWYKVWLFNIGIAIEINSVVVPYLVKKKWGRIVHISSASSTKGEPTFASGGSLPYASAKAYLNSYVQGLSKEFISKNVVISAVMPGPVHVKGKYWDILKNTDPSSVL